MIDLSQQEINDQFILACAKGDLNLIKHLYRHYPPHGTNFYSNSIRKLHNSFLSIFSPNKPNLQIQCNEYAGLRQACEHGRYNVVKFLISLKEISSPLKTSIHPNKIGRALTDCIETCLFNYNFKIADLLLPLIEQDAYFEFTMQHNFLKACLEGKFDIVQYMLTNSYFGKYHHNWINGKNSEFISSYQGFMYACENGHLKIVEYLVSSHELSEHVDINLIKKNLRIKNVEVLKYLISYFNLNKDHPFVSQIEFYPKSKLDSLLDKEHSKK